jgi:hypothetical protein
MTTNNIAYAPTSEIKKIIDEMEPVISEYPIEHVLMAMLSVAFIIINPNIKLEDLIQGVGQTSQFIGQFVSATSEPAADNDAIDAEFTTEDLDPSQVN